MSAQLLVQKKEDSKRKTERNFRVKLTRRGRRLVNHARRSPYRVQQGRFARVIETEEQHFDGLSPESETTHRAHKTLEERTEERRKHRCFLSFYFCEKETLKWGVFKKRDENKKNLLPKKMSE